MASKQVASKLKPLLNSTFENPNVKPLGSLLPRTNMPFLVLKSPEMTQATTISPTGVHARSPSGPCRAPTIACPPPPCACPPPPEVVTMSRRIARAIWFLAKLGIFVGVVKFTIDEGLWGDSAETEELAKRMGIISEERKDKKEDSKTSLVALWNDMVLKAGGVFGLDP